MTIDWAGIAVLYLAIGFGLSWLLLEVVHEHMPDSGLDKRTWSAVLVWLIFAFAWPVFFVWPPRPGGPRHG